MRTNGGTTGDAVSRVVVYVDGFNLYNGLKDLRGHRYLWLDLRALADTLLKPDQTLAGIRYFTARVRNEPDAEHRQATYLSALGMLPVVEVVEGRFQQKRRSCRACGTRWTTYEEKETDVSIAVALVEDAVSDRYDVAIVLSADSDLCPGVRAVKRLRPDKRIVAVFPPKRRSDDLRSAADAAFTLGEANVRKSLLPDDVHVAPDLVLSRPAKWR